MTKPDDPFERAQTPREQLAAEYEGAQAIAGIPMSYRDGSGKVHLKGQHIPLVSPTGQELQVFSDPRAQVCGNCKYYDLEAGRKELVRQRFAEKLVHDYEWKMHHLGAPPDAIALCGASGGELAVTFVSKSCDQFRPNNGRLRSVR